MVLYSSSDYGLKVALLDVQTRLRRLTSAEPHKSSLFLYHLGSYFITLRPIPATGACGQATITVLHTQYGRLPSAGAV